MALPTLITFVAGEDAVAEDVNTNFDRIAGRFNAGILDEDVSPTAAIKGYKLSSAAGDRVPETRLENNAVSARVLQEDVTAGAALAAVARASHIKDGIITNAKILPGCLLTTALKLTTITRTPSFFLVGDDSIFFDLEGTGWTGTAPTNGTYIPLFAGITGAAAEPSIPVKMAFYQVAGTGKWYLHVQNVTSIVFNTSALTVTVTVLGKS
jgi:hypothetical protein